MEGLQPVDAGQLRENTSSVSYYRDGHNPAFWFTDLGSTAKGGDGSCAKYDVPADPNLWNDIAADNLPSFSWIAPTTAATCTG